MAYSQNETIKLDDVPRSDGQVDMKELDKLINNSSGKIDLKEFDEWGYKKEKEIGINLTPLISQFIPFKGRTLGGPFTLMYRRGKNNQFFNLEIGASIESNFNNDDDNYFNLQVGYLRKNPLSQKTTIISSINFIISSGGFNVSGFQNNRGTIIGLSFSTGIEYSLTKKLSIGAQAYLIAASGDDFVLNFLPPVGVFLLGKF